MRMPISCHCAPAYWPESFQPAVEPIPNTSGRELETYALSIDRDGDFCASLTLEQLQLLHQAIGDFLEGLKPNEPVALVSLPVLSVLDED